MVRPNADWYQFATLVGGLDSRASGIETSELFLLSNCEICPNFWPVSYILLTKTRNAQTPFCEGALILNLQHSPPTSLILLLRIVCQPVYPLTSTRFASACGAIALFAAILGSNVLFDAQHALVPQASAESTFDYASDAIDYRNSRYPVTFAYPDYSKIDFNKALAKSNSTTNAAQSSDIWPEIRAGFRLEKFYSPLVKKHEQRFTKNPKQFERVLERASTYLPYLLEQVNQRDLPTEIVFLPLIESGYNPRIYSSRGAAGLWQFMPATGRVYGLVQDAWYEGRRDITRSTHAALNHLTDLNVRFDREWPLTFAAYNAGQNAIHRAIEANKKRNKPTDLQSLKLNSETRNFYPKLIAVKNIISNPAAYGIDLPKISMQSPFETIEFDFQIDLTRLASAIEVDLLHLAQLNPGLRRQATPPGGPHRILVPTEKLRETQAWKVDLHPSNAIGSVDYVVKPGDSLSEIAQQYAVSVYTLKVVNSKTSDLIKIGETIRIPTPRTVVDGNLGGVETVHTVVAGEYLGGIAQAYDVKLSQLRSINGISANSHLIKVGQKLRIPNDSSNSKNITVTASADSLQSRVVHVVRSGESLWKIARLYKVRIAELIKWNSISQRSLIRPNQKIVVYDRRLCQLTSN